MTQNYYSADSHGPNVCYFADSSHNSDPSVPYYSGHSYNAHSVHYTSTHTVVADTSCLTADNLHSDKDCADGTDCKVASSSHYPHNGHWLEHGARPHDVCVRSYLCWSEGCCNGECSKRFGYDVMTLGCCIACLRCRCSSWRLVLRMSVPCLLLCLWRMSRAQ